MGMMEIHTRYGYKSFQLNGSPITIEPIAASKTCMTRMAGTPKEALAAPLAPTIHQDLSIETPQWRNSFFNFTNTNVNSQRL